MTERNVQKWAPNGVNARGPVICNFEENRFGDVELPFMKKKFIAQSLSSNVSP